MRNARAPEMQLAGCRYVWDGCVELTGIGRKKEKEEENWKSSET